MTTWDFANPPIDATTQPAEQSASSPVEGEVIERLRDYADRYIGATRGEDMSLEEMLISQALECLTTRSVAVSSEAVAEAEGALKGIAGNETFMRRNKVAVSAWALASLINQARQLTGASQFDTELIEELKRLQSCDASYWHSKGCTSVKETVTKVLEKLGHAAV